MYDPLGTLLTIIRDDPGVAALTTRVRGGEPAPGDVQSKDDGWLRFIVLVRLGYDRDPQVPIQDVRIGINCYGTSYQDAAALAGAVSDAFHGRTPPSLNAQRFALYAAHDDGGPGASKDPDTDQPFETLTAALVASTMQAG